MNCRRLNPLIQVRESLLFERKIARTEILSHGDIFVRITFHSHFHHGRTNDLISLACSPRSNNVFSRAEQRKSRDHVARRIFASAAQQLFHFTQIPRNVLIVSPYFSANRRVERSRPFNIRSTVDVHTRLIFSTGEFGRERQEGRAWDGKMSMKRGGGRPDSDIWSRVPFLCGARRNERRGCGAGWRNQCRRKCILDHILPRCVRFSVSVTGYPGWRSLLSKERGGWTTLGS